jgi:hypothetical protein
MQKKKEKIEEVEFYKKAAGYFSYLMFEPLKLTAKQKKKVAIDLYHYFRKASNRAKAFEAYCGRIVLADMILPLYDNITHIELCEAFVHTKGLASIPALKTSYQEIAALIRKNPFLHLGVPLISRYYTLYLREPSRSRFSELQAELKNAGLSDSADYFVELLFVLAEHLTYQEPMYIERFDSNTGAMTLEVSKYRL